MHPMHALPARDPMQQQQQQHQHQMPLTNQQDQEQQQNTMTVLESLNPAHQHSLNTTSEQQAQVMGMIDPVQAQRQQHVVQQQHLVQQQQQQPHLHQLQPSQQTIEQVMSVDVDRQQQQQQHHHQQQHSIEQRPQIISGEGIVADSGGPIVQWLLENYEIAEGESLPRSTVYNHYLAHCRELQMASVNAASFGKLIRSVFVGLKTRRLGTRGHSKYHYFGVRAKQHVQHELLQHHEPGGGSSSAGCSRADQNDNSNHRTEDGSESDSTSLAGGANGGDCGRLSLGSPTKRLKRMSNQQHQPSSALYNPKGEHHPHHQQQHTIELASNGIYYASNNGNTATNGYGKIQQHHHHQHQLNGNNQASPTLDGCELADLRNHLGANWTTLVDEHWPQREMGLLEQQLIKANGGALDGTGQSEWPMYLELFESKYKSYYKRMVELLSELKFSEVEQLWLQFWRPQPAPQNNSIVQQQQSATASEHCWPSATTAAIDAGGSSSTNLQDQQQQQQQNGGHTQQQQVELTFHCLYQLTSQPLIVERINHIDYSLFAAIESFLFPDMLSPIPSLLRQQIEMFAINIGPCLEMAVKDYEPQFVSEKSKSTRAFGYALRRYVELNRLSTASRAIWEKRSSLTQLSMDLSRIDLRYIEHQVSLMTNHKRSDNLIISRLNSVNQLEREEANPVNGKTNTDGAHQRAAGGDETSNMTTTSTIDKIAGTANNENRPINDDNENAHHHNHNYQHHHRLCALQPGQLIQNFLHLLEDPYPANSWPDWCRNLFESRVCGLSMEEARSFVLDEWKNYISRIEKELTLRSAPSLSSFHLIKLLFGEYIDYLVDTRLAQAQHHHHQQQQHNSRTHLSSS